jgi:hypothetical protein
LNYRGDPQMTWQTLDRFLRVRLGHDAGNLAVQFIAEGLQRPGALHYLLPQEAN